MYFDPFAESEVILADERLGWGMEWRLTQDYIVNVPEWFQKRYKVTAQVLAPAGMLHDARSSPSLVSPFLPRQNPCTPADVIHDALYRMSRIINWLEGEIQRAKATGYIGTEGHLREILHVCIRVREAWTRKASDDFYFVHRKAMAKNAPIPLIGFRHPKNTRLGQWAGRSASWAGVRIGGWPFWQASPHEGFPSYVDKLAERYG